MKPAVWPRDERGEAKLLQVDPGAGTVSDRRLLELPSLLRAEDVLVVNDAGTLPASLAGVTSLGQVEVRLAGRGGTDRDWTAVLFGAGSWRQRTEDRAAPPELTAGEVIGFGHALKAEVRGVSPLSPRLVELRFNREGASLWSALYRQGRPVQYSHLCGPLALWHVQTAYGSRPWAVEMPSAGRPLGVALLGQLRRRGVRIATVTHAAGLSSTGDPGLDACLPLPERFEVPPATAEVVDAARRATGRVVAVGTSVVRALEASAARDGRVRPGLGVAALHISAGFEPRAVNGLLTGVHEPGTSHFDMLRAFAPEPLLAEARGRAEGWGYLGHEFGDLSLILAAEGRRSPPSAQPGPS